MSTEAGLFWVYMTARDDEQARGIGRALVEERLAACVNVLGPMNSFYWWNGAVQDDREVALIAKTRAERLPQLIERVKQLHSYTCPCIVVLPLVAGNPDYLAWLQAETSLGEPPAMG